MSISPILVDELRALVGSSDAAKIAGISVRYLQRLADEGTIWVLPTANGRLYDPDDLAAFAARREQ